MIWQDNCRVIVMTTKEVERGRVSTLHHICTIQVEAAHRLSVSVFYLTRIISRLMTVVPAQRNNKTHSLLFRLSAHGTGQMINK